MATPTKRSQSLLQKIKSLPPDKLAEVEDFVEFLRLRAEDRTVVQEFSRLSEPVLAMIWDNPDDAAYDKL